MSQAPILQPIRKDSRFKDRYKEEPVDEENPYVLSRNSGGGTSVG